eukprot:TRINITY_DN7067_c0_g1_i1.p1 TRINITY_DN7067_c0_g1~~TRINITY_DN7067_c0_g1_i1.p1  ORF type:complete len:140 (-),score=20.11 TRINITY_DN7067_c0_g1_i1:177-596(-)
MCIIGPLYFNSDPHENWQKAGWKWHKFVGPPPQTHESTPPVISKLYSYGQKIYCVCDNDLVYSITADIPTKPENWIEETDGLYSITGDFLVTDVPDLEFYATSRAYIFKALGNTDAFKIFKRKSDMPFGAEVVSITVAQ